MKVLKIGRRDEWTGEKRVRSAGKCEKVGGADGLVAICGKGAGDGRLRFAD